MHEDIQTDVEDGQPQFFYLLAFVLQGDVSARPAWVHPSGLLRSLLLDAEGPKLC